MAHPLPAPVRRRSYDGTPLGEPITYGQKVCLGFSEQLGARGFLGSMPPGRTQLTTQLINKAEVFMQVVPDGKRPPYACAWTILPEAVDDRIIAQGAPVAAGAPFVLVHCNSSKRLAGVHISLQTDFGLECAVCAHTYVQTSKVNKMMRETMGKPTSSLISQSETTENMWTVVYA